MTLTCPMVERRLVDHLCFSTGVQHTRRYTEDGPAKGRDEQHTSRLSLQSAVSVEIKANALAHSCPAKGYMPSGP